MQNSNIVLRRGPLCRKGPICKAFATGVISNAYLVIGMTKVEDIAILELISVVGRFSVICGAASLPYIR